MESGHIKITRKMVESKKCIGCLVGRMLVRNEQDREVDAYCKGCYCDRLMAKQEIIEAQMTAIRHCSLVFQNRAIATFIRYDMNHYYEDRVKEYKIISQGKKEIENILSLTSLEAVKKLDKKYQEELFAEPKKMGEKQ